MRQLQELIEYIIKRPLLTSFLVLILISLFVFGLSFPFYRNDFWSFYENVLVEAHGMIFDIAIIGILLFWLNQNGARLQRIRTYRDEIDDFRLWRSEEAAFRTVGNIKRLNRHGITEINLVNCYLSRTNLTHSKLGNSNLNNADLSHSILTECDLENARLNQTNMENSNLNRVKFLKAYASGANFKDAILIQANLQQAFLIKANFSNAYLMEADLRGSYLTGADFENANLYKADLRNTIGLSVNQLEKVRTLYMAKFDLEIEEQLKRDFPELLSK
jgi:BTB/POZ domain-containing protein KCTD9